MKLRRFLHMSTDFWEERANKVLSHFNYNHPHEINIHEICWRYGIKILPLDKYLIAPYTNYENINHLKAFSIPQSKGRRGLIFIKDNLNSIEKKLLLAEEFCHIYAHHSSQLLMDKHSIGKQENQARRMSAYLLMPKVFLKKFLNVAIDEDVLISEIADYFVVTEEFAQFRLELLFNRITDIITPHRFKLSKLTNKISLKLSYKDHF